MELRPLAHNGVFSAADARAVGLDNHALDRLIREGRCIRLARGWYAPITTAPDAEQRHRLTALALGRQFRDRAAISHYSRLVVARVATFAVDLDTVHLTLEERPTPAALPAPRPPASSGQSQAARRRKATAPGVDSPRRGLALHRPLRGLKAAPARTDVAVPPSPWGVPIAWAIVQTGLVAGAESAIVSADSALRMTLVTQEAIHDAVVQFTGHPGVATVRPVLSLADGRHESPGESRTAFLLRRLGFHLEPQFVVVAEGRRYRADFRISGTRVLVEFDGAVKYDEPGTVFAEKQREDALRRAGWVIVRLVWRDLASPDVVRRRVNQALALAVTA
jgi:very-short-patch-repair endonuclease